MRKATEEELVALHEIGDEVARSVREYFSDPSNLAVLDRLSGSGLAPTWESRAVQKTFSGQKVVFTGTLSELQRDEAKRLVEERGGRVTSSVSKNTSFVVVGESPGSKAEKAKELGVRVLTEKEFLGLIDGK